MKDAWFIQSNGLVKILQYGLGDNDYFVDMAKEIGNYFFSQEEAELAVRKLQAWKRLKDKGFKFNKWEAECRSGKGTISTNFNLWEGLKEEVVEDLDLLFSGGEE